MSSIPDTLRRIAEQIATLEAERDRLREELAAASYPGAGPGYCPGLDDPRCKGICDVRIRDGVLELVKPRCFEGTP